jgi:hypothetical protein
MRIDKLMSALGMGAALALRGCRMVLHPCTASLAQPAASYPKGLRSPGVVIPSLHGVIIHSKVTFWGIVPFVSQKQFRVVAAGYLYNEEHQE